MNNEHKTVYTLRLNGKTGAVISKRHYDHISNFIFSSLQFRDEITFNELLEKADLELSPQFNREYGWYLLQVKQDMEVRGLIKVFLNPDRVQSIRINKKKIQGYRGQ